MWKRGVDTPQWVKNAEFLEKPITTLYSSDDTTVTSKLVLNNISNEWALIHDKRASANVSLLSYPTNYRPVEDNPNNKRRYPVLKSSKGSDTILTHNKSIAGICDLHGVLDSLVDQDSEVFLLVIPIPFSKVWSMSSDAREFKRAFPNSILASTEKHPRLPDKDLLMPLVIGLLFFNRGIQSKLEFVCSSNYWRGPYKSQGVGTLLLELFEMRLSHTQVEAMPLNDRNAVSLYADNGWFFRKDEHLKWYAVRTKDVKFVASNDIPTHIPMYKYTGTESYTMLIRNESRALINALQETSDRVLAGEAKLNLLHDPVNI